MHVLLSAVLLCVCAGACAPTKTSFNRHHLHRPQLVWLQQLRPASQTASTKWTHWDLNPGSSACEADVMPLHHEPLMIRAQTAANFWLSKANGSCANCKHPGRRSNQTTVQLAQARSTLWGVMWAPAAAPSQPPLSSHKQLHSNTHKPTGHNRF